ncbi:MAG: PorP/SprF family type IX secretion system membrane protein [Bacteroidales bacterium]|nr:PorP/SprF family type IX secretion system membrane protein [Bacteroidales bacterium]
MNIFVKIVLFVVILCCMPATVKGQDVSFSQTYQAPLYLSPSYAGLTNGSRVGVNYRNQWPGIGNVYQDYSVYVDHFFERFNSGLGLVWICDNEGKGLLVDNQVNVVYSYEVPFTTDLFFRPGIAFEFGQRKLDQSKMITYTDITSDGRFVYGGSSIEFENTKRGRFDAAASVMLYNDRFSIGFAVDHLLRPDASFTDTKDIIKPKFTIDGSYRFDYEPSYRGSEPKTITLAANFKHQYSYNQLELGIYWYYYPIEIGALYRGLFFKMAGELSNTDAVVPTIGVNIPIKNNALRVGYSYDITVSKLSSFGNGAHEVSLIYRIIPDDVKHRSFKMKPVPCSEPIMGYSYSGSGGRGKGSHRGHGYKRRGIRK